MSKVEISHLITEKRNPSTMNLDQMTTREFLEVMNNEDAKVAFCVKEQLDQIEIAVHHIIQAFNQGGRLIYVGSGTSGRLGVLDAVECPPTFSTTDEVQGIIAGGPSAFVKSSCFIYLLKFPYSLAFISYNSYSMFQGFANHVSIIGSHILEYNLFVCSIHINCLFHIHNIAHILYHFLILH